MGIPFDDEYIAAHIEPILATPMGTAAYYAEHDTDARQALHQQHIDTMLEPVRSSEHLTLLIVQGPPGAGKTTLKERFLEYLGATNFDVDNYLNLDPTDVVTNLPECQYLKAQNDTRASAAVVVEAFDIVNKTLSQAFEKQVPIVAEYMSPRWDITPIIEEAKQQGYHVIQLTVATDLQTALERTHHRAAQAEGQHRNRDFIPDAITVKLDEVCRKYFAAGLEKADASYLVVNSGGLNEVSLVAATNKEGQLVVFDRDSYEQFKAPYPNVLYPNIQERDPEQKDRFVQESINACLQDRRRAASTGHGLIGME